MSRYETYKKGGLDWEPEVPKHWSLRRLSTLGRFKTGGTPPNKEGVESKGEIPWITPQDMWRFDIDRTKNFITSEAVKKLNYKLFHKGSILLVCIASIGKISICKKDSYSNQQITAITDMECNNRFLMYSLKGQMEKIKNDASSNVVPIINTKYLKTIMIPFPPDKEQKQIADYLDWKINEIDKLISIEKEKLKKLNSLFQSKLDSYFDICDSNKSNDGIKIKNVVEQITIRRKVLQPYIALEDIISQKGKLNKKAADLVKNEDGIAVEPGMIVFGKLRPYLAKCVLVDFCANCSSEFLVVKPIGINTKYLKYLMLSNTFVNLVNSSTYGTKMPRANSEYILNLRVKLKNIEEQIKDVEAIECIERIIDKNVGIVNDRIDELSKLKETLISEVVTGQIDVRKVVIPAYEKVDSIVDEEIEGEELLEDGD